MPSKRDQLGGMLNQVATDIEPPLRKGSGLAGMIGTPGESIESQRGDNTQMRNSETAESQQSDNAQPQSSLTAQTLSGEKAEKQNNERVERKSRGVLVHPRLYKAMQAYALDAEVKD